VPSVSHLLNRSLEVLRESVVADAVGGESVAYTAVGEVRGRISRRAGKETNTATQEGADIEADIYLEPDADVRRNDYLADGSDRWEVLHVVYPSDTVYRKAVSRLKVPARPLDLEASS
jgi:head-tail adaptor